LPTHAQLIILTHSFCIASWAAGARHHCTAVHVYMRERGPEIPLHQQSTNLDMQLVDFCHALLLGCSTPAHKSRRHLLSRCTLPRAYLGGMSAYCSDNSASIISSRIAARATLALNSGEWFFRLSISDRLFRHAIHLNDWSETSRAAQFAGV